VCEDGVVFIVDYEEEGEGIDLRVIQTLYLWNVWSFNLVKSKKKRADTAVLGTATQ
jgi:hypothetical protein